MATHPGAKRGTEKINHTPWIGILPPSSGEDGGGGTARLQVLRWTFSFDLGQRMALILLLESPAHRCFLSPGERSKAWGSNQDGIVWILSLCQQLLLFSCWVVPDSLRPHGLQHTRHPSPSPSPGVCSNSCPLSRWYHPTISSSVIPFSFCLQSFPAPGSFPVSQLFTQVSQRTGASASASVLPMNIQGWFPLGLTGLISLQSKGLLRVFSSTTIRKHQFFGTQLSLWSNFHTHTWLLEKT